MQVCCLSHQWWQHVLIWDASWSAQLPGLCEIYLCHHKPPCRVAYTIWQEQSKHGLTKTDSCLHLVLEINTYLHSINLASTCLSSDIRLNPDDSATLTTFKSLLTNSTLAWLVFLLKFKLKSKGLCCSKNISEKTLKTLLFLSFSPFVPVWLSHLILCNIYSFFFFSSTPCLLHLKHLFSSFLLKLVIDRGPEVMCGPNEQDQ